MPSVSEMDFVEGLDDESMQPTKQSAGCACLMVVAMFATIIGTVVIACLEYFWR